MSPVSLKLELRPLQRVLYRTPPRPTSLIRSCVHRAGESVIRSCVLTVRGSVNRSCVLTVRGRA